MSEFFWFNGTFVIGAHIVAGTLAVIIAAELEGPSESEFITIFMAVVLYLLLLIIYTATGLFLMLIASVFRGVA